MSEPDFAPALRQTILREIPGAVGLTGLHRLSGGASQETWSFKTELDGGKTKPLIMRRAPHGGTQESTTGSRAPGLETEAKVIRYVTKRGVAAPNVPYIFQPSDGVGRAYLMEHVEGETIARKILRDPEFAAVRPKLARQCGQILARLHAVDIAGLDVELRVTTGRQLLEQYREIYDGHNYPHPMFDVALKWLDGRIKDTPNPKLVHGDFRHGNLMIAPDGVRAMLDWEIVHIGDPLEDLSWICVNSWRFGVTEKIVGGFGDVEDLLAGYAEAGGHPYTPEDVKAWEVMGTMRWGIMCMGMYQAFATGYDRTVERAAIGRRSSETEIDLVNLLLAGRKE
jgi:aminoglycoside phosphotransferase (APT) family kinase protein